MRGIRVWARLLGLRGMVVEGVEVEGDEVVVLVGSCWQERDGCRCCRRRCGRYDGGSGRRRWRALDPGDDVVFVGGGGAAGRLPRARCGRRRGPVGVA